MLAAFVLIALTGAFGVAMLAIAARVSVERRGDDVVVTNAGPAVHGGRVSVTIAGGNYAVARDLPRGVTTIPLREFDPRPPAATTGWGGATVTGARLGVGWTWYAAGDVRATAGTERHAPETPR